MFKIVFRDKNTYFAKRDAINPGIRLLDLSRIENPKTKNVLPLSDWYMDILSIELDEQIARRSGVFLETGTVTVFLKESLFFNEFVLTKFKNASDNTMSVYYKLDEAKILAAWEQAGFPLSW